MSTATETMPGGGIATATAVAPEPSLLDQCVAATKQTDRDRTEELLKTLTDEALKKTITWDKSVTNSVQKAIAEIDKNLSKQLAAVLHHPDLQRLEGSYRGLHHLVMNSETSSKLRIKVMTATKAEVAKDLEKAAEFDQSVSFKKLYESEYGSPGGEPYGALIADYEFSNLPDDINMLGNLSNVAAAAFCPCITAAAPDLFGFDSWTDLSKPRDLEKIFDSIEFVQWRSFRETEDSRFVVLTLPRVLSRLPYGALTKPIEEFDFEEVDLDAKGRSKPVPNEKYTWMNAAFVVGTRLTDAFAQSGWCTAIRGAEGGGKVEGLPAHIFISDDGDPDLKCPTEIGITDRREAELDKLGFVSLCHYKNTDYAVFFGSATAQKPKKYDRPEATANAAISARLSYIMAASRFAHYIKVIARDKIGSFAEASDVEAQLQRWVLNYVNANPSAGQALKAKYPLAAAQVQVREIPGSPGAYNAVFWLRPWLQLEELTTSLRMVARIPTA
jgi:type VI secretion system protein ImpC